MDTMEMQEAYGRAEVSEPEGAPESWTDQDRADYLANVPFAD